MRQQTSYYGNPWLGMFVKTNDRITLLPKDSMDKLEAALRENLKTETVRISVADSNILGVYIAMNSNGIVLPNIMTEEELGTIRKCGLNVCVSGDRYNAHGNNVAVSDKAGVVNPHVERDEVKKMEDALGVELCPATIAGHTTVGSACIATNNGFLVHYRASEDEMAELKNILKVPGSRGTVNKGTGFVAYGAVVNRNGYAVGEGTTPFEMGRLEEALGLIK